MKKLVIAIALISTQFVAKAQTKWATDRAHTNVKFTAEHLGIYEVDGLFRSFNGTFIAARPDFADAIIEFTVDVNSIYTDNDKRDGHLKSDDFFNVEKYPQLKFKSTSFKKKTGNAYALTGNLTIRDVTKPVTFDVIYGGTTKDAYGNTKIGFKAITTINRFDYGLKWNGLAEATSIVGKDIQIKVNAQFAQAN